MLDRPAKSTIESHTACKLFSERCEGAGPSGICSSRFLRELATNLLTRTTSSRARQWEMNISDLYSWVVTLTVIQDTFWRLIQLLETYVKINRCMDTYGAISSSPSCNGRWDFKLREIRCSATYPFPGNNLSPLSVSNSLQKSILTFEALWQIIVDDIPTLT